EEVHHERTIRDCPADGASDRDRERRDLSGTGSWGLFGRSAGSARLLHAGGDAGGSAGQSARSGRGLAARGPRRGQRSTGRPRGRGVKPVSGKRMCRLLEARGWLLARVKGSHHIYLHPSTRRRTTVPLRATKDLKP